MAVNNFLQNVLDKLMPVVNLTFVFDCFVPKKWSDCGGLGTWIYEIVLIFVFEFQKIIFAVPILLHDTNLLIGSEMYK